MSSKQRACWAGPITLGLWAPFHPDTPTNRGTAWVNRAGARQGPVPVRPAWAPGHSLAAEPLLPPPGAWHRAQQAGTGKAPRGLPASRDGWPLQPWPRAPGPGVPPHEQGCLWPRGPSQRAPQHAARSVQRHCPMNACQGHGALLPGSPGVSREVSGNSSTVGSQGQTLPGGLLCGSNVYGPARPPLHLTGRPPA